MSQIIIVQANGTTSTWDLTQVNPKAQLSAADFLPPPLPAGWKLMKAPVKGELAMRHLAAAVIALTFAAPLCAQDKAKDRDQVLDRWEAAMSGAPGIQSGCIRTYEDPTFKEKHEYRGTITFQRGPALGTVYGINVRLTKVGDPKVTDNLIYSRGSLIEVSPATKTIRELVVDPKTVENCPLVGFAFGIKAKEAKERYAIDLVHVDEHYYYLRIAPKTDADKTHFRSANIALTRADCFPRELQLIQANGSKTTWSLPTYGGFKIAGGDFGAPELTEGWTKV